MIQDGFILVDKPEGWTSFKTDRFVGKLLGTRKVGHLGTLDPFATGLLPVFVGKAVSLKGRPSFRLIYKDESVLNHKVA